MSPRIAPVGISDTNSGYLAWATRVLPFSVLSGDLPMRLRYQYFRSPRCFSFAWLNLFLYSRAASGRSTRSLSEFSIPGGSLR